MTAATAGRPRVLIAAESTIAAGSLSAELTGLGYAVCAAVDSAEQALQAALEERPPLVLMDVRLAHGGDGIETARRIRSVHDAAIVFLTAHADESTLARAVEVSPFGYVIKPFRARDLKVTIGLALAKHAQDAAAVRELHAQATTDPLTGLANRRQLDAVLAAEWDRCRNRGISLAVVMADIDHFKAFNDACGHLAGDGCLTRVARALARACRSWEAVLGRWGGEEFLAILPAADVAGAMAVAEEMVAAVRGARLACPPRGPAGIVTLSAGAAAVVPEADRSVNVLVELADRGLYAAKQDGRDRVAPAPPPGAQQEGGAN